MTCWPAARMLGVIASCAIACAAQAGYRLVPVEGPWIPRIEGEASLLPDGRVLLSGGRRGPAAGPTASTEIFDPVTRRMSPGPRMVVPRTQHAALTLPDGRVLMAGGSTLTYIVPSTSAEIVHPDFGSEVIGDMALPRGGDPFLVLGPDGSAFVFGGTQEGRFGQTNALVERLPPGATSWEPAGHLLLPCQADWIRLDAETVLRMPGGSDRTGSPPLQLICRSWAEEWLLTPRPTARLIDAFGALPGHEFRAGAVVGSRLVAVMAEQGVLDIDLSGARPPRVVGPPDLVPSLTGPCMAGASEDEFILFGPDIRILHLVSGRADDVVAWTRRSNFTAIVVSPGIILIAGGSETRAPTGRGAPQPPLLLIRDPMAGR